MADLPQSLSEYLTMFFECQKDNKINFPKIECIEGHCKNNCKISDETGEEKYNDIWNKKVSYYQFQSVRETYYTKEGVQKFYTRTARKDFRDVPLCDVYEKFLSCAQSYLVNRYHTLLDKVYWEQYIDEVDGAIMWMDYSQNIKLTENKTGTECSFFGKTTNIT